ncbi:MAG: DMT family transporter [Candidatus Eiseniibacteriota bacterium]
MPLSVSAAMLLHVLLSAGTFLIAKVALASFEPAALAQLRFVIASAALVGLALAGASGAPHTSRPAQTPRAPWPSRADWPVLVLLGLLGTTVNQGLFLFGLARTRPAHAALLYAMTPILVLCIAWLRGIERVEGRRALGVGLAFAGGVYLLSGRGFSFERAHVLGDALVFLAVVAWALYTVRSKELLTRIAPVPLTAWAMAVGTILFLPIGVPAVLRVDFTRIPTAAWIGLFYLALVTSVVSYLIWARALARVDASRVAVFTNLQPIATALLAWAFLGEGLTLHFVLAAAAVIAGVWMVERG